MNLEFGESCSDLFNFDDNSRFVADNDQAFSFSNFCLEPEAAQESDSVSSIDISEITSMQQDMTTESLSPPQVVPTMSVVPASISPSQTVAREVTMAAPATPGTPTLTPSAEASMIISVAPSGNTSKPTGRKPSNASLNGLPAQGKGRPASKKGARATGLLSSTPTPIAPASPLSTLTSASGVSAMQTIKPAAIARRPSTSSPSLLAKSVPPRPTAQRIAPNLGPRVPIAPSVTARRHSSPALSRPGPPLQSAAKRRKGSETYIPLTPPDSTPSSPAEKAILFSNRLAMDSMSPSFEFPQFFLYDPNLIAASGAVDFDPSTPISVASTPSMPLSISRPGTPDEQGVSMMPPPANGLVGLVAAPEEHKPYRCQVPGCDKAYKNANGLKYHGLHGHPFDTQQVEKPYKCQFAGCGKAYKNPNGLKYHIGHAHSLVPLAQGSLITPQQVSASFQ